MIELIQKYAMGGSAVKLASAVEKLVRSGKIPPDALLPPVRPLAQALGISPGTAAAAYKALKSRGLVTADRRRGTRTMAHPAFREYVEAPLRPGAVELRVANPDPQLLPDLHPVFRSIDATSGEYGGSHIDAALEQWARRDLSPDGLKAPNLTVSAGATAALHDALKACLSPGDKVAVEDPGFNDHHAMVAGLQMLCVPVAIDDEGMRPEALRRALRAGATAVLLTPRCQSPFGAALTPARAAKLKDVLAEVPQALVLLDDYASLLTAWPYRDVLDKAHERWLVVRSFNKVLGADIRVAIASGAPEVVDRLRREQAFRGEWVSAYLQRAAARALSSRQGQAVVSRARKEYERRRSALLHALAERGVRAHGASGLHVWVPVDDEASVVAAMAERGWGIRAGARYRIASAPGVRITVSRLLPDAAERLADDLRAALQRGFGGAP